MRSQWQEEKTSHGGHGGHGVAENRYTLPAGFRVISKGVASIHDRAGGALRAVFPVAGIPRNALFWFRTV